MNAGDRRVRPFDHDAHGSAGWLARKDSNPRSPDPELAEVAAA
jgi:hypothetical protein